ncbi:MAG TPA: trypsin-like peptidase domain-containing protein [Actinomycetota bacterium]
MKRAILALAALAVVGLPACITTSSTHATDAAAAAAAVKVAANAESRPVNLQQLNLAPTRTGAYDPAKDPTVQVVQRVQPAVVNVTTDLFESTPFGGTQPGQGVGTGFIVRSDGVIVTNYHVVEHAQRITVITPATANSDGQSYPARVIGGDQSADLAILKIDTTGLPTVPLGNSSDLLLGERVIAMGYALALKGGPTVSSGIVSALGRVINAQDPNCTRTVCPGGGRKYSDVIQTDAAINPGNSGGPLLDLNGNVVGINTAGSGSAENIGFAIPINDAKSTIEDAMQNPGAAVAYLGVVTEDVTPGLAAQFSLPVNDGAYVVSTAPGGPAEKAGISSGDVIVSFDGTKVTGSEQLGTLIHKHQPGDRVQVQAVGSSGGQRTVDVTLGVNPLP